MPGIIAAAWVVAAWFRPEADFVVFPVLVAASFPIGYRLALGPLELPLAAAAAIAGVMTVVVIALLMGIAGILGGPLLVEPVGPVGQASLLGACGGVAGFVVSRWPRRHASS